MEEFVDFFVNAMKSGSDADFEQTISAMRAHLATAGLEVPAVEEATEPNSECKKNRLTQLTVMTDCLSSMRALHIQYRSMR